MLETPPPSSVSVAAPSSVPGGDESPTGEVADHRPRIEGGRSAGWLFEGCRCQGLGFGLLGYR